MKRCLVTGLIMWLCCFAAGAQNKVPPIDQSAMDMSYFPANYPILKIQDKISEPLLARTVYSRPLAKGRTVFGELVEYDKVWRIGANEATEVEFYQNVVIGGKTVTKGRYTLYAIPNVQQWTMILNSELDTWGSFKYDSKKDIVRVTVPVKQLSEPVDPFSIYFEKTADGFMLVVAWENSMVMLPVKVNNTPAKPVKKK
jgi:hypothetical protein